MKRTNIILTVVMLAQCLLIYGRGYVDAIGNYAIGAQFVFFALVTILPPLLSWLEAKPKARA